MEKKNVIRGGALRAHVGIIRTLPLFIATSREPFKKDIFTFWAIEMYRTLCQVSGEDEKNAMPTSFMYMMIQITSFGVDFVFDFANYLAEEIHVGLVGIAKGKVEKTFGHYSLLMHMFLLKGVTYFGKEMELNRDQDGEALPIQL